MGQNKLEKQFKEKLNSREIKPTEMAWDRLNSMLTQAEQINQDQSSKKRKTKFDWLYIAASFIGILIVSSVFYQQKENTIDLKKNTVVTKNTITTEKSKTTIQPENLKPNFSRSILKLENNSLVETNSEIERKIENVASTNQEQSVAEVKSVDQKVIIAKNNDAVPENIESLLASVEKKPNHKNLSVKIDASTLLNQVDGELQMSFREKTINAITQKYKETAEALASRNNQ
jgi:hypothetical protein